ncbi:MAG: TIGR02147 family protein [Alphaproteobacteria bacterium]|nr:TIGR02147 family protein [Alphaproteobacteria bacterium]
MHTLLDLLAPLSDPYRLEARTMPDIYTYSDYRLYLEDWFNAAGRRLTKRGFARKAGCSPSLVVGILKGRNKLDAQRAERFAEVMKLDDDETSYFVSMVRFAHGFSRADRQAAWEAMVSAGRFRGSRAIGLETYAVFSRWYYAAIVELASCEGFRAEPAWIAATLRPAITEAQAAEALELLLRRGLLTGKADGGLQVVEEAWRTEHEIYSREVSIAVASLHESMLERAAEALSTVDWRERHYATYTIAVPSERMEELKERISRFQEQIMHLCMGFGEPRDRVVQLGVQLFPLSMDSPSTEV